MSNNLYNTECVRDSLNLECYNKHMKEPMINNILVRFKSEDGHESLDVNFDPAHETVWLTQTQIADLFDTSIDNVGLHLKNIFDDEELDEYSTTEDFSVVRNEGSRKVKRQIKHYNLDAILSVGYRVKSKQATKFRKWVNGVLSDYLKKGYIINQTKIKIPNLCEITQMLDTYRQFDGDLPLSGNDVLQFLIAYNKGLTILDDYDHRTFRTPEGIRDTYLINYSECMDIIHRSKFSGKSDNFARERDQSFKSSISTIYQTFDGKELYPTLESKAANLLYLITKNHSFIDGNKRIASTIFLYFLDRNNALFISGNKRINDETLAALAILIAASDPKDKELLINLILVILG
jgi:prophage maintenance system killer protein/prophage antirepressor-like protein